MAERTLVLARESGEELAEQRAVDAGTRSGWGRRSAAFAVRGAARSTGATSRMGTGACVLAGRRQGRALSHGAQASACGHADHELMKR